ncbi:protein UL133 [Panine betaherpesvirus 2]|uniref:Protein UL133 n=1 Tax=Panine betaherpesvirus 2 TaxID=188763 RepID=Q8QRW6_9BETA|nr:protein UL133 [Panine betaherpesvirus 2]AAM00758.1 protein UL133 [Panine betaherpesvirus 2]QXV67886.1 protein UL133 [Panine betaherpesvirus 2]
MGRCETICTPACECIWGNIITFSVLTVAGSLAIWSIAASNGTTPGIVSLVLTGLLFIYLIIYVIRFPQLAREVYVDFFTCKWVFWCSSKCTSGSLYDVVRFQRGQHTDQEGENRDRVICEVVAKPPEDPGEGPSDPSSQPLCEVKVEIPNPNTKPETKPEKPEKPKKPKAGGRSKSKSTEKPASKSTSEKEKTSGDMGTKATTPTVPTTPAPTPTPVPAPAPQPTVSGVPQALPPDLAAIVQAAVTAALAAAAQQQQQTPPP